MFKGVGLKLFVSSEDVIKKEINNLSLLISILLL